MLSSMLLITAVTLAPFTATAKDYLNDESMAQIDLLDYQLIDLSENQNVALYKMKRLETPSAEVIKSLEEESNSTVVSPILELDQKSSFKNIYVYIGKKEDGTYEYCEARENRNGRLFVVDMNITEATQTELRLVHGISGSQTNYKLVTGRNLFP